MTLCTVPTASSAQMRQRRPGRPPNGKRLPLAGREMPGKLRSVYRRSLDPCDNSNDSGLGFDHHTDPHHTMGLSERVTWTGERAEAKRPRMDIKVEGEEANDNYSFPGIKTCKESSISLIRTAPAGSVPSLNISNSVPSSSGRAVPRCVPLTGRQTSSSPVSLTTQLSAASRYNDVTLAIVKQPEQQHRARYQTEGSRGAVKDRDGNGFPVVQLRGYYKPATLQVFIGTDFGKVSPHMFYQACKVSGKNSTPCIEKKIDGTCVIELQLDPSKDMGATCDCVGILKERNVDVEHRFPDQLGNRSKKKSTRCRMIFRTTIVLEDGSQETLQVCSQPIICTQPPGVPEICKKSLKACPANGGMELFVLGKNFLKDTKVFFQEFDQGRVKWEGSVTPDKEYLQQTHFVCVVPPYCRPDIIEPVEVRLCVVSSGKTSEYHQFVYTPVTGSMSSVHAVVEPVVVPQQPPFPKGVWHSVSKHKQDLDMMPPPESSMVPLASARRPSMSMSNEVHSPPLHGLKQEYIDESSNSSMMDAMDVRHERFRHISESSLDVHHGDSNMSMMTDNSMDMINHQGNSMMCENSNLSINEDSVDTMVRRNSMSRSRAAAICESSMDVNTGMSLINEDSSCSSMMHPMQQPTEKVMDLRMKMPLADLLANGAGAPLMSMSRFAMLDAQAQPALPPQSAQSVENYLNGIEKNMGMSGEGLLKTMMAQQQQPQQPLLSRASTDPVYLTTSRPFLSGTIQSDAVCTMVAKSEAAAVAENTMIEQTTTIAQTTLTSCLDSTVPTPINTERLDAFVNSTLESHIGNPSKVTTAASITLPTATTSSNAIITSDIMLNSRNLMVPAMINTALPSPDMAQATSIPPEVILNPQISPSMMCAPSGGMGQDALLGTMVAQEKAVLLQATVDLLQTQKKINELTTTITSPQTDIMTMASAGSSVLAGGDAMAQMGTSYVATQYATVPTMMAKPQECGAVPIAGKDISNGDKKNEDRMIPPVFTTLTENELINLINPSCFDQV